MDCLKYFQSHTNYFWQWEDNGNVAAIPDGTTIAYRDFIIDFLNEIQDQGLPSFGALLLFIIATNDTASNDLVFIKKNLRRESEWKNYIDDAFDFLQIVSSLPVKYKRGKNRMQLAQTIFCNSHRRTSVKNARYITRNFSLQSFGMNKVLQKEKLNDKVIESDLRVIAILLKKMPSAKDIVDRMASVPELEEEIILENDVKEIISNLKKDFIEELLEDEKTFQIGALITQIWSGLNIPFHNTLPSQQPIGGVSDLTNKGDFDRLLISEFANEDLLFLSRLANNEALYINREIPPHQNDLDRIILIDVSLKNWGTPRIIAYALMLAIAKHPKTDIHCIAFAVGNEMCSIKFECVDDIIESLYLLDDCLFPRNGLENFCKTYSTRKNMEVIFISSVNAVRAPVMQKLLADHHDLFNYWIYTDSEGGIDLYKKSNKSKKYVQHIELPLEKLWQQEKRAKPAINNLGNYKDDIEYPILFPVSSYKLLLNTASGKLFAITNDGKLLQHYLTGDYRKGWKLLQDNINVRAKMEIGEISNVLGNTMLLMFDIERKEITLLNINTGSQKKISFPEWRTSAYHDFLFHEGCFHYLEKHQYRYIDPLSGDMTLNQYVPPLSLKNTYEQRRKELSKLSLKSFPNFDVLKNIPEVFINTEGNIVFNKHALVINKFGVLKFESTPCLQKKHEARLIGNNEYVFSCGSSIINKGGMFILRHANGSYEFDKEKVELHCCDEMIFIPAVLNKQLGVATITHYAGNAFYYISNKNKIIDTSEFWKLHISPFIEKIKSYEASN